MTPEIKARIENNLALVEHIVTRMAAGFPDSTERDELVIAGMTGLVEASTRFDPDRGIAFSTFAGRRIEGAILDVVRREDWLPRSVRAKARHVDAVEERFVAAGRTDASSTEIAELAGMTVGELDKLRAQVRQGVIVALDRPVRMGDSTVSLGDTIADDDAEDPAEMLEAREMKAYVRSAIHLLPERHRLVIVAYFLEEKPMDEIAAFLGVTQSRVSQIKDDALKRIRAGVAVQYQTEPSEAPVRRRRDRSRAEYAAAIGKHSTPMERLVDVDGIGAV